MSQRLQQASPCPAIDVRSQGEFAKGSFPLVANIPILNDEHRHQVGLCYKQKGQPKAIELGHQLVEPIKGGLAKSWLQVAAQCEEQAQELLVFCWRGGLRSKIASQWMAEAGAHPLRVEGGFKGLRRQALRALGDLPPMLVLGGMTGSGKTRLLAELNNKLDLEGLARHRGSAFGLLPRESQPCQMDFENHLALSLSAAQGKELIVEDESRRIGRISLPNGMYEHMARCPFVLLEVSVRERAHNIFMEYISAPLVSGEESEVLRVHMKSCTERIRRKLGGVRTDEVLTQIDRAFSTGDVEDHLQWIGFLLVNYYDPLYGHSMERKGANPVFSGNYEECLDYFKML
ncbi:MAG: tRNA 2-selenouridine(34) synthase MnmH [Bdellovibrionaceae bacterium]|nr:tRNA 2-selenouridine(34) synthase MnmH [Bdellovibrionales bacterium]MCB9084094.1 tRNA 2-selenouridine(34) synthase MnmH [Pseudobdellovibrionaceae bacterium]